MTDPDKVGNWCCNSNQCAHDSTCYDNVSEINATGSSAACILGENIDHNTNGSTNYKYATNDGQLFYCGTSTSDTSPYVQVTNFIPGDRVDNCLCQSNNAWDCSGVINIRRGRLVIS